MLKIVTASVNDIAVIKQLADAIWPETYARILSPQQSAYMMDMMYSEESLKYQIEKQQYTFIIVYDNEVPVAFASYYPKYKSSQALFRLSKIYVAQNLQGKGIGKNIIDHIISSVKPLGASILELNVNRANKAISFYEKLGFIITKDEDIAIGNGYFMNDHVMQKAL